ncbi:hypothetical protein GCM10010116_03450 [Microbispora rosea subsp. aerata]|nr:hypothetical protein GCM10010116_03450 [Microbispora rosea subsp. aerata]GIH54754.1 hypothetical protein Mro02_16680 [Microbispora rosea subsp. aerata]GLJ82383.1 hypothetical protein GCM10017588_11080 [Microbispora rosea subsp. aerata]
MLASGLHESRSGSVPVMQVSQCRQCLLPGVQAPPPAALFGTAGADELGQAGKGAVRQGIAAG